MSLPELVEALGCKRPGCTCQHRAAHSLHNFCVHCPAHDDKTPSLSITQGSDGKLLFHCHAGCSQEAVLAALKMQGLWPDAAVSLLPKDKAVSNRDIPNRQDIPNRRERRIAATYDYTDEDGKLLFQVVRREPKVFSQRKPGKAPGTWENNMADVRRVLYHLPEVLSAVQKDKPVYLAEGEKDVDALQELGLCATCNPMGAGKWDDAYSESLAGAKVTILPDNDDVGRAHAHRAATGLYGKAKHIRVVALPDLPDKGDVSDWLKAGGTKEDLQALIKVTPDWTPNSAPPTAALNPQPLPTVASKPKTIAERIVDLADVGPPGEPPLLFGPYLLKGVVHWLTGPTGIGKSTLVYNLACALAEGMPLWGEKCEQIRVLYIDPENSDIGRALKIGRLYLDGQRVRGRLFFLPEPPHFPGDLDELLVFVRDNDISLVIFDTARRCFSVRDENDNAEVYNRIVPVLDALKLAGVASLTLGHPAKNGNGSARGAGAQEDMGDVNLSLTMHKGDIGDKDGIVGLSVTKNRLLGFDIPPLLLARKGDDHFERVESASSPLDLEDSPSKKDRCCEILLKCLNETDDGQASFSILRTAASKAGIVGGTVNRAIKSLVEMGNVRHLPGHGYQLCDPVADAAS